MAQQRNIAARAGRWSARHRKLALLGWLAFVLAAMIIGGATGTNYQREEDLGSGESGRADKIIAEGFVDHAGEQVLVQSRGRARSTIPSSRRRSTTSSAGSPASRSWPMSSLRGRTAPASSRRTAARPWCSSTSSETRRLRASVWSRCWRPSHAARPRIRVPIEEFGDASASRAISKAFEEDARQAEFLSLP